MKNKTPSYPPCKGEARYLLRLRFPNCVSAIFHSSLFTLHFSLKIPNKRLLIPTCRASIVLHDVIVLILVEEVDIVL